MLSAFVRILGCVAICRRIAESAVARLPPRLVVSVDPAVAHRIRAIPNVAVDIGAHGTGAEGRTVIRKRRRSDDRGRARHAGRAAGRAHAVAGAERHDDLVATTTPTVARHTRGTWQ